MEGDKLNVLSWTSPRHKTSSIAVGPSLWERGWDTAMGVFWSHLLLSQLQPSVTQPRVKQPIWKCVRNTSLLAESWHQWATASKTEGVPQPSCGPFGPFGIRRVIGETVLCMNMGNYKTFWSRNKNQSFPDESSFECTAVEALSASVYSLFPLVSSDAAFAPELGCFSTHSSWSQINEN